jgi:hypothetical protein
MMKACHRNRNQEKLVIPANPPSPMSHELLPLWQDTVEKEEKKTQLMKALKMKKQEEEE